MAQQSFHDEEYVIYYSDYQGKYGGEDRVCQAQKHGAEVGHCTWHPNSPDPNRHSRLNGGCPYRGKRYCRG